VKVIVVVGVPLPGVAPPSYSFVGPSTAATGSVNDSSRNAAVAIVASS
jgi:hypothetical protein